MATATLKDLMKTYFSPYKFSDADEAHWKNFEVTHLIDGAAYFKAIYDEIQKTGSQAGDFIHITGWAISKNFRLPDQSPSSDTLIKILSDKATKPATGASKVDVKVSAMFSTSRNNPAYWVWSWLPYEDLWDRNWEFIEECRAKGIKNAILDDNTSYTGAHHIKAVTIRNSEGIFAFLGGIDLHEMRQDSTAHLALKDPQNSNPPELNAQNWHDCAVMLRGYAAFEVWEDFYLRWNYCAMTILTSAWNSYFGKQYRKYLLLPKDIYKIEETEYNENKTICESFTARANSAANPNTYSNAGSSTPSAAVIARSYGSTVLNNLQLTRRLYFAKSDWVNKYSSSITDYQTSIIKAITNAKKYIYMEDQSFCGPESLLFDIADVCATIVFKHLAKAAKRGVKVILVTTRAVDPLDNTGATYRTVEKTVTYEYLLKPLGYDDASAAALNVAFFASDHFYIHSKLVIVDDEFYGIGSANAFDRSLMGTDTELTCLVVAEQSTDQGKPHPVKDLRRHLWMEAMGLQVYTDRIAAAGGGKWPLVGREKDMWDSLFDIDKALGIWRRRWAPSGTTYPCETAGYPCRLLDPGTTSMALPSYLLHNMMAF